MHREEGDSFYTYLLRKVLTYPDQPEPAEISGLRTVRAFARKDYEAAEDVGCVRG